MGKKTAECEILRQAVEVGRAKKFVAPAMIASGRYRVAAVCPVLGVERSNVIERRLADRRGVIGSDAVPSMIRAHRQLRALAYGYSDCGHCYVVFGLLVANRQETSSVSIGSRRLVSCCSGDIPVRLRSVWRESCRGRAQRSALLLG